MPTPIRRALVMALVGALAGAAAVIIAYSRHAGLTLEMDRELPRIASGFYPPERAGDDTFAWTAMRARVALAGLDRRSAWHCAIRFRGGRSAPLAQPIVQLAADGGIASKLATNTYDTLDVVAPARPDASGLMLTITNSTAFVPGPSDSRELGVQIDRLACEPIGTGLALPPRDTLVAAALAAALFGVALGLVGIGWWPVAGIVLLAVLQAMPLSSGPAPYTMYASQALWLAGWTALSIVVGVRAIELVKGKALETTACAVIALSAAVFYLKMLGLLHPSKPLIDAVFHAHRFERVLAGSYYFTQPVRNAEFPYAIALYVFAAPWATLVRDHVTLLRTVVCASEVLAGALLYPMIVRTWGDRLMGVVAVVLFHCVPLPYGVLGNANLTNAFGQAAALVAIAAATVWRLGTRDIAQVVGLALLCALALLSHVSTFASFSLTVFAMACLYWLMGSPALRPQARSIASALAIAVIVSIVAYYGHFLNVYMSMGRVSAQTQQTQTAAAASSQPHASDDATPSRAGRFVRGLEQSASDIGWPILILAAVGAWRVWSRGRDRLVLALGAWGIAWLALFVVGSLAPAGRDFERYAIEFLSRLDQAVYPAVVILAAAGSVWAWRAGRIARIAAAVLLLGASTIAVREWLRWFV